MPVEAREIMNKGVVKVGLETTVQEAAKLMLGLDVGSLLVMDGEKLVGIVTKSDYVRMVAKGIPQDAKVRQIMSSPVVTCESSANLEELINLMRVHKIRHIPIVEGDRVVGIVADFDLACWATSQLKKISILIRPPKA